MSPNLQDERSYPSMPPSFWQRLFPSGTPPGKKEQDLEALAARVQALEQQHQAELAVLRQQLEQLEQQQQQQQQQSEKEDGQGLLYSGTWTVELTGENYVHFSPTFNLGGFLFRMVVTEKKEKGDDDMRLIAGREAESAQEKVEGRRPIIIGVYLEHLPSSILGGGGEAAAPCVQCRFKLPIVPEDEKEGGKEGVKEVVYTSKPGFLREGAKLGYYPLLHVRDDPPRPFPLSKKQQQQRSVLHFGFEVSLRTVHFMGVSEQAQAMRNAWALMEVTVEEQLRAALVKEEKKRVAAEMRMREKGEWKEVMDSCLFVGGGGGEGGRRESGEEEKVCVEGSCDENEEEDDEKKKEKEEEKEEEEEKEKNEEKEEVRAGGPDQNERRRRENTGGREAEGEEEEKVEQTNEDDDDDDDGDGYEEEEDEEIYGEEEEDIEVKGA